MMHLPFRLSARLSPRRRLLVAVAAIALLSACVHNPATDLPPAGTIPPDQFLFQRGDASMKRERFDDARKYYQQIVDNYPQSPLRADAKLGVGDSYLEQAGDANLVLAENEFKEFLTFYPTSTRADYAQYKLAMSHFTRMRAAERDQTETAAAVREWRVC